MAESWKVLGQSAPAATTDIDLYTVPVATAFIGKIFIANRGAVSALVRVALRSLGAALANQHYLVYDVSVPVGSTLEVTGLAGNTTDVVTIRASTADVSFSLIGTEIT